MKSTLTSPRPVALDLRLPGISALQRLALVIAWIVAAGIGYAAYQRVTTPAQTALTGQIVSVQRGSIAATVSTTGSVMATTNAKVGFGVSGTLAKLLVQVGDSVHQGQPLAQLDQTDLKLKVTQAEAQVASAQAKLAQIQQGSRQDQIAAAESSVSSAKAKLAQLQAGPTDADLQAAAASVAAAKSSLASAQSKLSSLQSQPNPDDVKAAQLQLDKAQKSFVSAQIDRNGVCGRGDKSNACYQGDASVAAAQTAITTAQANLQKVSEPATADDFKAAQDAVASAQTAYDSAVAKLQQVQAGATIADIAAAKSAVDSAISDLALKATPYTPADIQGAQAGIDQAKAGLASAQNQLDNATLLAPFAGNVAAISMSPGEAVGGSSAITLVDPKAVRVDATVDETDVAKLELGQTADFTFDALQGRQFTGKVIAISPSGTVQAGVVTYVFSLSIADPAGLKPGMTANANIVYSSRDNVLLVPNRAIRAQGRSKVVDVVVAGKSQLQPVQVGMSNDRYTEITDGVQEGDQVLIPTTATSTPRASGVIPGGGGFGGQGGGFQFRSGN